MICMFWGCNSLTKINFTKFKTNNIVNMEKMFHNETKGKVALIGVGGLY